MLRYSNSSEAGRDTEIVVDNDTLKMLVKLQEQFAQLEEMGDNEYRGFYIELPRPTQEEWGDCEASIADGEYESTEEYLRDWELSNPRETVWYHVSSARYREIAPYNSRIGNTRILLLRIILDI